MFCKRRKGGFVMTDGYSMQATVHVDESGVEHVMLHRVPDGVSVTLSELLTKPYPYLHKVIK